MADIVLQAESLSKSYNGLQAVKNLSLEVREGEVFGFLGPNGAGKTTTINMLCGLLRPDSGRVLLRGQPVLGGSAEVKAMVGVCPQEIVLWERLTCLEQLVFHRPDVRAERARCEGEQPGLLNELDLQEKRDKLAQTLSGGMQRRLNIAMALVHDPRDPGAGRAGGRTGPAEPGQGARVHPVAGAAQDGHPHHPQHGRGRPAGRPGGDHRPRRAARARYARAAQAARRRGGRGRNPPGERPGRRRRGAAALAEIATDVSLDPAGQVLRVRALNAVGRLAGILEALTAAGLTPGEVNLRANTLEDVFIQLTGRRLRE